MAEGRSDDSLAAVVVVALLLLTAWGNAYAMLLFSCLGLIFGFWKYRGRLLRGAWLAAVAGAFVVAVLSVVLVLSMR
jgi:hypothetical protein